MSSLRVSQPSGERGRAGQGQALVEFALVLPLLILFLLLASDIARAFDVYIAAGNMAREGAHYGSLTAANARDAAGIREAALEEGATLAAAAPTVESALGEDPDGFASVHVTVTYAFHPLVALPPIPKTITVRRSAEMRVLGS